jgi:hypothetical protein
LCVDFIHNFNLFSFIILGRKLCWKTQLQILLHVYRVISFPSRIHFCLRSYSSRSLANRDQRLLGRDPNVAVQRRRIGHLFPVRVVGNWSGWLPHVPNVKRSNDKRGHQGFLFDEGRTAIDQSIFARKYLPKLLLHSLWTATAVAHRQVRRRTFSICFIKVSMSLSLGEES